MEALSEAEMLSQVLDRRISEIHTALPGKVESYDYQTQKADVSPQVEIDGEALPVIPSVPVLFPRGKASFICYNLDPGDFGLLIFCEADIGTWQQRGEVGNPGDQGRHGVQGAVFIPGLVPNGNELTMPSGDAVLLSGNDIRLGGLTATDFVLKGTSFDTAFGVWATAMNVWANAVEASLGPVLPPGTTGTFTAATTALATAVSNALSAAVKVR